MFTKIEYEIGALLVRDTAKGVIRVLTLLKIDEKTLVFWSVLVLFQGLRQSLGTNQEGKITIGRRM
jgi:hypothetical protein